MNSTRSIAGLVVVISNALVLLGSRDGPAQPERGGEETIQEISADVVSHSIDPKSAQRLWELSEQLLEA